MTAMDVITVAGMLVLTGVVLWLFFSWNDKFTAKRIAWRRVEMAKILFKQNTPSWGADFETAEPLVQEHYLKRADEVLAFANRTAPRT